MLLTEQEIDAIHPMIKPFPEWRLAFARAIESAVIEKIEARGASAWASVSDDGIVEALGFNQSRSRFTIPLYQLPEGD